MKSSVTKPATAVEQCQVKSRKTPFSFLEKTIYMLHKYFKESSIHIGSWNSSVHYEVANTVLKFKEESHAIWRVFF